MTSRFLQFPNFPYLTWVECLRKPVLREGFWGLQPIWNFFGKVEIFDPRFYCCLWISPMSCLLCDMWNFWAIALSGDILKNVAKIGCLGDFGDNFLTIGAKLTFKKPKWPPFKEESNAFFNFFLSLTVRKIFAITPKKSIFLQLTADPLRVQVHSNSQGIWVTTTTDGQ